MDLMENDLLFTFYSFCIQFLSIPATKAGCLVLTTPRRILLICASKRLLTMIWQKSSNARYLSCPVFCQDVKSIRTWNPDNWSWSEVSTLLNLREKRLCYNILSIFPSKLYIPHATFDLPDKHNSYLPLYKYHLVCEIKEL